MHGKAYSTTWLVKIHGGDFSKFWFGQTVSNLGSSFTRFALPLLVFKLTGSALNLGVATAAQFIPYLLFGLVIGAAVDRVDRKRIMIATDIARALVIAAIPSLAAVGALTVWWIYVLSFVSSTLTIFFDSGEFAAIPSLVKRDDLVKGNGRIQASYSAAMVVGPFLAGLLLSVMSISAILVFDAISFVVSAISLSLIKTSFNSKSAERESRASLRADVVEGLRYVWGHPVLRNISIMMALVNFVGSTTAAQLVLFAKRQFEANDSQVALLYSAGAVGIVILSLLAGTLRKRWTFSKVALGALMLDGLFILAFAAIQSYWIGLLFWAVSSGLGMLFNINTGSLRQSIVPNHLLGRVISVASVLAWSAIPLGTFLGGAVIQGTGKVALVYAGIGIMTILIPLVFAFTALGRAEKYILPEGQSKQ